MSFLPESEIVINCAINAPSSKVFQAWNDPAAIKKWWGPNGFTTPHCSIDFRIGGIFHYCMRSPEGDEFWGRGVYREIIKSEKIVYIDTFSDEKGSIKTAEDYGLSKDQPIESLVTVTFVESDGVTTVTVFHAIDSIPEEKEMAKNGWKEMLDRLAEYVTKL